MSVSTATELERVQLNVRWAAATDVGKVREVNEDSYLTTPGFWLVADGMGGHKAGDVASRITVETCSGAADEVPMSLDRLAKAVADSNEHVREEASRTGQIGMGTTAVGVALIDNGGEDALVVFNVGDSRCYVLDETGSVSLLTTDHSLVQELVDGGEITAEEARIHPERNVVTRAIGIDDVVAADFFVLPRDAGSRLLLCSDGVSGELSDGEIAVVLESADSPADATEMLVEAVLDGPAPDNATAVVLDVGWADTSSGVAPAADSVVTGPRPLSSTPASDSKSGDSGADLIADVPGVDSAAATQSIQSSTNNVADFIDGVPE